MNDASKYTSARVYNGKRSCEEEGEVFQRACRREFQSLVNVSRFKGSKLVSKEFGQAKEN